MSFHVVDVDVFAGLDITGSNADMFTVLHNRLALGDIAGSQLVVNGDIFQGSNGNILSVAELGHAVALGNRLDSDNHIVLFINNQSVSHNVFLQSFYHKLPFSSKPQSCSSPSSSIWGWSFTSSTSASDTQM